MNPLYCNKHVNIKLTPRRAIKQSIREFTAPLYFFVSFILVDPFPYFGDTCAIFHHIYNVCRVFLNVSNNSDKGALEYILNVSKPGAVHLYTRAVPESDLHCQFGKHCLVVY